MPTYSYGCLDCGNLFEEDLKIADREKPTTEPCSNCGEFKVIKQVDTGNLISMVGSARTRMNSDQREVFQRIKNAHPRSTMPDFK